MIDNVVRNGRMLEFRSVVLFKVNVVSESDQYSLVMAQRHHLSEGQKWRIIGRIEGGQTQMEVAQDLNIPQSVISRVWSRFLSTGSVDRQPGQGRPRATTASEDRFLSLSARRNREATTRDLVLDLQAATGTRISRSTAARRLNEVGLYARKPMVCVPLTPASKGARLNWCRRHVQWSQEDWARVLFTDESRYSLNSDSRRVLIWREEGTRNLPSLVREISRFRDRGLMVWGGIMTNGRTELHIFQGGSVTARRYVDEVLEPQVRLFRGAVGPEFLLMDDNARPHRAYVVSEYLQTEDITRMDWPPYSPDLNPIEHVWNASGRRIAARQIPPRTLQELKSALLEEWRAIPQDLINTLVKSMKSRCEVCISVRGGHTPY